MTKYQHLFSPIKIGTVEVPNRIALLPMGVFSSRMMNNDGSYTKDGADYYIERAKGGTSASVCCSSVLVCYACAVSDQKKIIVVSAVNVM